MNQKIIDEITARLDKLVEPYLTRDEGGRFVEIDGYPRRVHKHKDNGLCNWPLIVEKKGYNYVEWWLLFEKPPQWLTSSERVFYFNWGENLCHPKKYGWAYGKGSDNLGEALRGFERMLEDVPKRDFKSKTSAEPKGI